MFKKYLVIATTAAMIGVTSLVGCGGQASQSTTETAAASQSATTETTDTTTTKTKASTSDSTSADTSAATSTDTTNTTTTTTEITPEEAKAIALKDAGFSEADVYELKAERDMDDATPHYDVEFKNGNMEYDYDISMDGSILSAHSEYDD